MFALPKLMIGKYSIIGKGDGGLSSTLCGASSITDVKNLEDICSDASGDGKSTGHLAVFVISQLLMGIGTTPLYTLGMFFFSFFLKKVKEILSIFSIFNDNDVTNLASINLKKAII